MVAGRKWENEITRRAPPPSMAAFMEESLSRLGPAESSTDILPLNPPVLRKTLPRMQKEMKMIKDEDAHFNLGVKRPPSFPHCLQPVVSRGKAPQRHPFPEALRGPFSQFRYEPPPGDLDGFPGVFEGGGSRKRKSVPTKMPYTHPSEEAALGLHSEESKLHGHPNFPLLFPQPPRPKYDSQMIDLCNVGFQFYRSLEPLGGKRVKQEPVNHYPKVPPGLLFPFFVPTASPFPFSRHAFLPKQPPDPLLPRKAEPPEGEEAKQKVERMDVNVQIDDSYYVDVGGAQKRWQCPTCEKSYTSKYNLVTHILGHSGIKPHACTRCGKLFKQLSHLHTHMLTHQGTRPHKCQVCHKAFTQTSHLKRHMMQHSEVKPHNCRVCGRGFAYPSELKAHEAKHANGRENICVECGLDFPTLAQLKRHLTTHRGPIQYNCSECDKTFQYPSQLQNHMMKHKDIRPYICSECGMEFVQPHHLKQHSLTHKGVKEHKCGICGREFTLLANMKRHVLIHTNIRAYQCHLCYKSFVQKQTLKAHMIVHSDVKPFKCKLCGKEFNRMHNLMGHMHLHSDSKPFKCLYCPSKFTLKGNLTRHMKVKHGVMERGLHSQGFGRGRLALAQAGVLRSLEQEEPFDLSQKRRAFQSDGESARGSSCHEEEDEDHCCEVERDSPGPASRSRQRCVPQDLSTKPETAPRAPQEACEEEEEEEEEEEAAVQKEGRQEKSKDSHGAEGGQERDGARREECPSLRALQSARRGASFSDYLYFKHRDETLKELLERKMEKQAVLLGI
ncbi:PREDICTED: LOW QUALITY PROTEIN: zinc finger protein 366 [Myotis davidii]|uniref:LOW QUALITY PROTEIN: zinc finger protein 366 n=1 Tax=Myotis davidii TaxID=225400 RepID=UPI0003EC3154|nr:PREDICTED: LOW QUALITY PROTEIN: zinc finger protein 366 [Myotis davidii]